MMLLHLLLLKSNNKKLTFTSRQQQFIRALEDDGLIPCHHEKFNLLMETWSTYIQLTKEDLSMYSKMKELFIIVYNEKWFDCYLSLTYYFWRTSNLEKEKLVDSNLRL